MTRSQTLLEALDGRALLLTGATGFIGKVVLAMALERCGLERVYVLVRPKPDRSPEERFFDTIESSPALESLRKHKGGEFSAFLRERVRVVAGDVTLPRMGLSDEAVAEMRGRVHAVVNVAGLVALNPGLDESLQINTRGALHAVQAAQALDAALVHMSTCYTAGYRDGAVREDEEVLGYFPKNQERAARFSAPAELEQCERLVAALADEAARGRDGRFREAAFRRLVDKGTVRPSERLLQAAAARQAKRWLDEKLVEEGRARAEEWGWPNIYCYTKALGEQLIAATPGLRFTIVRPSIVESALRYPFPGWNEGLTTSAPVILAMCAGHAVWPAHRRAALDVIPVDMVAAATLAAAAALLRGDAARVYQMGSSHANPLSIRRCMKLVSEYRRARWRDHTPDALWAHWLWTRVGVIPSSEGVYRAVGVPTFRKLFARAGAAAARLFGEGRLQRSLRRMERDLGQVEHVIETFMPFMHGMDPVFRTDNLTGLYAAASPEDRRNLPWDPERLDWRSYWLDVHTEGLRRWVFPGFPGRHGGPLRPAYRPVVERAGRAALDLVCRLFYGGFFRVRRDGLSHVPATSGFLVASNHASHLDMGLIKHGLGPIGNELVSLAARDYFFSNRALAWFFKTFTNLLPIGRGRAVGEALNAAVHELKRGSSLLIFPEATRSLTGEMGAFRPTIGYLALKSRADVLPAFVEGTARALPKGALLPRARRMHVRFGPAITYAELRAATLGLPEKDAYREAAALIERAVRALAGPEPDPNLRTAARPG